MHNLITSGIHRGGLKVTPYVTSHVVEVPLPTLKWSQKLS